MTINDDQWYLTKLFFWWDISLVPAIQVIQVIQVVQVIQLIQAMEVKLAHLWPACRVIFVWFKRCSLVTLHKIINRPRLLLCILTPSLSALPACCLVCFVPLRHLLFCRLPLLINELPLLPLWVLVPRMMVGVCGSRMMADAVGLMELPSPSSSFVLFCSPLVMT